MGSTVNRIPDIARRMRHPATILEPSRATSGGKISLATIQWNDLIFTAVPPIQSARLSAQLIERCTLIFVQYAAIGLVPGATRASVWVRDLTVTFNVVGALNKGIEIQAGQMLTIEADNEEYLNPMQFAVVIAGTALQPPTIIHIGFGVTS